jgi:branched-chain amino acid transport system permease protein
VSRRIAIAVSLLALAGAPAWTGSDYYLNVVSQILIGAVFALALNVLVGYCGLVSIGHGALFGIAAYGAALLLNAGYGHLVAILLSLALTLVTAALFSVLSLRASGIGFMMITLAIGQLLWGLAYRWVTLTNGENGISLAARPEPLGLSLASATAFFYATLVVFLAALASMTSLIRSPFGASLVGTREQPRRMTALGYSVWRIRFLACLFSGMWSGVAGLLFLYYNQFISPHAMSLSASAEALLMVIAGGSGTVLGPIGGAALVVMMKTVASAYIERWNFVLGAIFVLIVLLMPEGVLPGSVRLFCAGWARLKGSDGRA